MGIRLGLVVVVLLLSGVPLARASAGYTPDGYACGKGGKPMPELGACLCPEGKAHARRDADNVAICVRDGRKRLSGATQLATRGGLQCALMPRGRVACWPGGSYGYDASGYGEDRDVPVELAGISGATHLAVTNDTACVVVDGDEVRCVRFPETPRVTDATDATDAIAPPEVVLEHQFAADVVSLTATDDRACAATELGDVLCWPLGLEPAPPEHVHDLEDLVEDVVEIEARGTHTCARSRQGEVWCWSHDPEEAPARVDLGGATAISVSSDAVCAAVESGTVRCWQASGTYVEIPELRGIVEISAIPDIGCARNRKGAVWCWDSARDGAVRPVRISALPKIAELDGDCLRTTKGHVMCLQRWDHGDPDGVHHVPRPRKARRR